MRGHRRYIACRGTIAVKTTSGITTGTLKGWTVVNLNDTEYMVVAIRDSGTTKVYVSSSTTTTPSFTEITGTAGTYPDTRLSLDGDVCFASIRNPLNAGDAYAGYDMLVFSNGAEVILYNPRDGGGSIPITAAYAPGESVIKQSAGFTRYLNMAAANVTSSSSDGDVSHNNDQAHPTTLGLTPYASFSTAVEVDSTDWAKFAFTTGDVLCEGRDLVIVYDTVNFADPWSCLKIEVSVDDATYYTLYTPGTDPLPPIVDCSKSFLQAAFKIDHTVISSSLTVKYVKFTWVAAQAPTTNPADIYFMAFLGGGMMRGNWTLGAAYGNYIWLGQGYVAEDREGRNLKMMGLQDARNDVQVEVSPLMHYAHYLEFKAPTQTYLDKGSPYLAIFGTQSDTADLLYLQAVTLATYSGGWNSTYTIGANVTSTVNVEAPLSTKRMPDGLNEVIPPCKSMIAASGRLFCGRGLSYNATRDSDIMFSEQDNPFNFRAIVGVLSDGTVDERSGGAMFFGGEQVQGMGRVSNPIQDTDTVIVVTDNGASMLGGRLTTALTRPIRVSNYGTLSPRSVVTYKNAVFWFDTDRQVRIFTEGKPASISRDKIDDVLLGVSASRLAYVSAHCRNDFLYLAYSPSGGSTNSQVAVYDMIHQTWVIDEPTYSTTFGGFFTFNGELRYWTEAGVLNQHESTSGTQDGGSTDITCTIKTAEFSPGGLVMESQFHVPWVYAEADSGHTLTLTVNARRKGTTSAGTCSLTSSEAYLKKAAPRTVGLEDDAASLTISGVLSAGKKIIAAGIGHTVKPSTDPFTRD